MLQSMTVWYEDLAENQDLARNLKLVLSKSLLTIKQEAKNFCVISGDAVLLDVVTRRTFEEILNIFCKSPAEKFLQILELAV